MYFFFIFFRTSVEWLFTLQSKAFGFCEYKEPESTLRALRLLHELLLGDKKLLVKVDAKTKAQLDEWKAKNRSANVVDCWPTKQDINLIFLLLINCTIYVFHSAF